MMKDLRTISLPLLALVTILTQPFLAAHAEILEDAQFEVYRLEGRYRYIGPETEVTLDSGEMRSYSFPLPIRTVIRKEDGEFSLQADGVELFVRRTGEIPPEGIPFAVRLYDGKELPFRVLSRMGEDTLSQVAPTMGELNEDPTAVEAPRARLAMPRAPSVDEVLRNALRAFKGGTVPVGFVKESSRVGSLFSLNDSLRITFVKGYTSENYKIHILEAKNLSPAALSLSTKEIIFPGCRGMIMTSATLNSFDPIQKARDNKTTNIAHIVVAGENVDGAFLKACPLFN